MHHEHDLDYEAHQRRSEDDSEYGDPRSFRDERYATRRYGDEGPYGRERTWREPYDQGPSYDRPWSSPRRGADRPWGYGRDRGSGADWERGYDPQSEAPNEAPRRHATSRTMSTTCSTATRTTSSWNGGGTERGPAATRRHARFALTWPGIRQVTDTGTTRGRETR